MEIEGMHEPSCNAGCIGGVHRMLSDAEARWFEEHPDGETA